MHDKQKVILISSYAPPALGGPQILYNLLRNTEPDSYCILTSYYHIDNLSARVGSWLSGEYIFYDKITDRKTRGKSKGDLGTTSKRREFIEKTKHHIRNSKLARELLGPIILLSQIIAIVFVGRKSIKKRSIKSIVGFSDYGPAMIGAYILHKITKKTFNIFLFDIYKGNSFPFPGKQLANIFEPKIFKSAKTIIVTNEGTRDFYINRYGQELSKKIVIIHNSVFKDGYFKKEKKENGQKSAYSIVFTGRIYWPQIKSIKNMIRAISEINDLDIKMKIYSPSPKDYLKKIGIEESEKIEISVAPPEKMPEVQSGADILFLPLSWGTESQYIIDTATPGKLTDYLVAGRPILIHAPASTFLVKYARENEFAKIVDEENIEKLKDGIRKILTDEKFSNKIVANAKKTFLENHDAEKNSHRFEKILFD